MIGYKSWLLDFDYTHHTKVRFANNDTIGIVGMGKVTIKKRNGQNTYVIDVMYVWCHP